MTRAQILARGDLEVEWLLTAIPAIMHHIRTADTDEASAKSAKVGLAEAHRRLYVLDDVLHRVKS